MGVLIKIVYGYRSKWYHKLRHNFTDPSRLLQSLLTRESRKDTACMLVVKDEQETIENMIMSTRSIVDHYIVVDKNGGTIPYIKSLGVDAEYHIKPELNLQQSRRYALQQLKNTWLLIIDGDEFLTKDGCDFIKKHRNHPHTYLRTCKNMLLKDGKTPIVNNGYHNTLLHNNGTIKIPRDRDLPVMSGRAIHAHKPVVFNDHRHKEYHGKTTNYDLVVQGEIPEELKQ